MIIGYGRSRIGIKEIKELTIISENKFLDKWFSEIEQERIFGESSSYDKHDELIACYWNIKVATLIALGYSQNNHSVNYQDIEVSHDRSGNYNIQLHKDLKKLVGDLQVKKVRIKFNRLENIVEANVELNVR